MRTVGVAGLCGALAAGVLLAIVADLGVAAPVTPVGLVVLVGMCIVVLTMWARAMKRAAPSSHHGNDPGTAVAAVACAQTAMIAGAALGGFHIVYALAFVRHLDIPLPRERVIWASVTTLMAAAFGYSGKLLENACKGHDGGPEDPVDDGNDGTTGQ
ncbi:DUF3180 family protein [Propionibacterium cyclohexanicum]|uniref:DUF3180 family protein n=1 Tax=Propionibacterium cyclohexanicum TaxID=64702 RepID=UPI0015A584CB|nr:DUF3180 family protein [Propionibacterium cyclohexanicum]